MDQQSDLLFGSNSLREALRNGRPITRVWFARDRNDRITAEIIGLCRKANIPYSKVERSFLDRLSRDTVHQGFAAQAAAKAYTPWRTMLLEATAREQCPLLVVLDEVEDPHNLGASIRSAEALGAHGMVIPKHRAAPLSAGADRASAGALEYMPVDRVANIAQTLDEMKKEGLWIFGAASDTGLSIYEADWTVAAALVMGGEHKGLTPLIQKKCDIIVHIPMSGQVNSLNVSAAAAAILSEINRQRRMR
ncbi:MAG: 23S rRNA (guanosine(2251)-2'-O)-methyltransferase RlmB [Clostridiales bacterium]|nr:23S rRNA (guanosine(2251)-2'-O)-methyltransferase RlmB [Clostridiales bacterium]